MHKRRLYIRSILLFSLLLQTSVSLDAIAQDQTQTPTTTTGTGSSAQDCDPVGGVRCGASLYRDPSSAPPETTPNAQSGNPINLLTGNKYQREVDFSLPDTDLQFVRHYNSVNVDFNYGVGQGWGHSFDVRLSRFGTPANTSGFKLRQSTGKSVDFLIIEQDAASTTIFRAHSASDGYLIQQDETKANQFTWVLPDGRRLSFQGSFLVRIDFPGHRYLKLFYREGKLAEISDETNRLITIEYSLASSGLSEYGVGNFSIPGHIEKIVLPDGSAINYQYNDSKNLSRVIYPDTTFREYHYENEIYPHHLTGITNRKGIRSSSWTYNDLGWADSSSHANDVESVSLKYEVNDDQYSGFTTAINSLGLATTYHWQLNEATEARELTSSDGPGCATCPAGDMRYSYNESGQLESASRLSGATKRYEYDEHGRLTGVYKTEHPLIETNPIERLTLAYEYTDLHNLPLRISRPSVNPDGFSELELEYNDELLPIRLTQHGFAPVISDGTDPIKVDQFKAISRTTQFHYSNARLETIDGPKKGNLDTTIFGYDELQRINSVRLPSGLQISYESFDAMGRTTAMRIGANSTPLQFKYNDRNQLLTLSYRGRNQTYAYDSAGNLTQVVDGAGKATFYSYDDADRVVEVQNSVGASNQYEIDTENQITQHRSVSRMGRTIQSIDYAYDALGKLDNINQTEEHASTGQISVSNSTYLHNQLGQLISVLNTGNTNQIILSYSAHGQLDRLTKSDATGQTQSVSRLFDHKGQDIGFVDQRENKTLYIKDDFGQTIYQTHPDTGTVINSYDESGNIVTTQPDKNQQENFKYDNANRMVERNIGAARTQFAYHPINGKLTRASNEHSTDEYTYNSIGDLVEHKRTIDGRSFITRFEYTPTGQLSRKHLLDGKILRYHYRNDTANEPERIELITAFGLIRRTLLSEIDADMSDGVAGHRYFDKIDRTVDYYDDNRISTVRSGSAYSADYRYNIKGYVSEIAEPDNTQRFGYHNGHLTSYRDKFGAYGYAYDDIGNQTRAVAKLNDGSHQLNKFTYSDKGDGNQLLSVELNGITSEIDYSNEGSALSGLNGLTFEYDEQKRPAVVYQLGNKIAEYKYNSFGERVKKVTYAHGNTRVTYYFYESNRLSAEFTPDENSSHYLYSNGHPAIAIVDAELYAIHTDHQGTPRSLENVKGETVWAANYDPFGKTHTTSNKVDFNLRFPGQYYDAETTNHYNYYRYYNPTLARYNSSDPIGISGGNNTYLYANANPHNFIDPLGLNATGAQAATPPPAPAHTTTPPNLMRPGTGPVPNPGPAANEARIRPATLTRLRQLAGRGGYASIIALSSMAGYVAGTETRKWVDQNINNPAAINDLLNQIQRYNPDYSPGEFLVNWQNIRALGTYLYGLQAAYYEFHTSVCSLDFNPNLFDDAVIALGPKYLHPSLEGTPYVDPYETMFPNRQAYEQAKQEFAAYQGSGGSLSFLDWLSRIYWGLSHGDDEYEGQEPPDTAHKTGAWEAYKNDPDNAGWSYSRWSNVYDSNQLNALRGNQIAADYHASAGWGEPERSVTHLLPPSLVAAQGGRRHDFGEDNKGVEVKSGYTYLSPTIQAQINADAYLVSQGWEIEWHFNDRPTAPLLEELDRRGIPWTIRDPANRPRSY